MFHKKKNSGAFKDRNLWPEPPKLQPLEVKVEYGLEDAIKRFKSIFQKEKVVALLKEKSSYEKPSDKRRRKKREARERQLLLEMRERLMKSGEWDRRIRRKQRRKDDKLRRKIQRHVQADIDIFNDQETNNP